MAESKIKRGVLNQIKNPLIFFGLALLVIESIIGVTVAASGMSDNQKFYSVLVMAGLFLAVILTNSGNLTIKWPTHLYEQIAKQTETTKEIETFLNSTAFREPCLFRRGAKIQLMFSLPFRIINVQKKTTEQGFIK